MGGHNIDKIHFLRDCFYLYKTIVEIDKWSTGWVLDFVHGSRMLTCQHLYVNKVQSDIGFNWSSTNSLDLNHYTSNSWRCKFFTFIVRSWYLKPLTKITAYNILTVGFAKVHYFEIQLSIKRNISFQLMSSDKDINDWKKILFCVEIRILFIQHKKYQL